MAKVKNVEKRIWDLEGFDVKILHPDGRDVRGDMEGLPPYTRYERAAKNEMTVTDWKEVRFKPMYAGFDVEVLNGHGDIVHGATKLGNVRDSYDED
jgi:hypothetical protein